MPGITGRRKTLNQVTISRRNGYFHSHVHCRIIHNSKDMEQCKSPLMDEWKKGMVEMCSRQEAQEKIKV